MHHMNRNPWFRSALFQVWQKMMKDAKKMMRAGLHLNSEDGFPVEPFLRDFDKFVLWARVCKGYERGKMDDYRLERYRLNEGFIPENLFFTKLPPANVMAEEATITRGAKCEFKEQKGTKWSGLSRTRLYDIWKTMVRRCTDKGRCDYNDYGGRGIAVCDEWRKDFIVFYNWAWDHGYSPFLTLDRVDVNGGYCPENCRWAGDLEKRLNRRRYNQMYRNVRLKVKDMRDILAAMDDNAVVTITARAALFPDSEFVEADYPPIPMDDRVDVDRKK